MHLTALLLGAAFVFTNTLARVLEHPCTPHEDYMTCMLYWVTNTGVVLDMDDPREFEAWAHATIYSPSCMPWGATKNGLSSNVKVFAWGLDYSHPLILNPAMVPGMGYNTPRFEYHDEVWGYADCVCDMVNVVERIHTCKCPFQCEPKPVIG